MTTQNDFLPFATGPGANVVDQTTYAALSALATGFLSGTALSNQLNKVWRQSSIMSAVIAQFIVAQTGQAAVDDGTTPTLLSNFTKAVNAASKQRVILTDTGSVNVLAAANAVPMTALPTVSGVVQTVAVKITNTGASTYSPDGLAARPIFGLGGTALQGGEMVANGIATLVSYVGPLLNGGALCWVLFECIGGAQQVAPATQSQHAMQLGQATGRLLRTSVYFLSGSTVMCSVNGGTAAALSTWAQLASTNSIEYEGCGAGGGSAGSGGQGATTVGIGGSGGSGSFGKGYLTSGFSGVQNITIGAGGAAGTVAPTAGGNGTATSFGSLATWPGGGGGQPTNGVTTPAISGSGAGGAIPTGCNVFASAGHAGGIGIASGLQVMVSGDGGSTPYGSGGSAVPVNSAGSNGSGFGAGASGGCSGANGAGKIGGIGSNGLLIIREYA